MLSGYLPVLDWGRRYTRANLAADLMAAVIVTIMLIPQSPAYAMLAGLPPETGLYASIIPVLLYALFGTSSALAVGPVAIVSLMTASAVGGAASTGLATPAAAALTLAFLSGGMLLLMGLFRLGFIANFLSHPVTAGFITASGLLIALGQLGAILGRVAGDPDIRHVVLLCSAVNEVDLSALESLESLNDRLRDMGMALHLSEVKGPVMDRLCRSQFLADLSGEVFLNQYQAVEKLTA